MNTHELREERQAKDATIRKPVIIWVVRVVMSCTCDPSVAVKALGSVMYNCGPRGVLSLTPVIHYPDYLTPKLTLWYTSDNTEML